MARAQYFVVRHENQWKISFNKSAYPGSIPGVASTT